MTRPAQLDLLSRWRAPDGFLFEQDGVGVVGAGVARRAVVAPGAGLLARAAEAAQAMLDEVGVAGAVAAAALPFRGDTPALVIVPGHLTVTGTSPRRITVALSPEIAAAPSGHPGQAWPLRWRAEPSAADYAAAVAAAARRVRAGDLEKVVLSRSLVAAVEGIDPGRLLAHLRDRDPGCHLFAAPAAAGGVFLGASPETLLRKQGDTVLSVPLAGTAPRSPDPGIDAESGAALLRSAKDRREHAPVVAAVADTLAPHCISLSVESEPHLLATASVWHLATAVRGRLRASAPSALGLAAELHPTPAVCGTPRGRAAELIAELEPGSRGLYAGLVGWVDSRGDGEWAVSLRCAMVGERSIRLYAGAGIVAGSQPDAELAETDVKFRTLIDALASMEPTPSAVTSSA